MVKSEKDRCPKCGGELRYYDCVKRVVKTPDRHVLYLSRVKCLTCGSVHRVSGDLKPYEQYPDSVIKNGETSVDGYPCRMTVYRRTRK